VRPLLQLGLLKDSPLSLLLQRLRSAALTLASLLLLPMLLGLGLSSPAKKLRGLRAGGCVGEVGALSSKLTKGTTGSSAGEARQQHHRHTHTKGKQAAAL
jgi:hypothetical protein